MILNCNVPSTCVDYCISKLIFLIVLLGIIFTHNKSNKKFTLYPVSENFAYSLFRLVCILEARKYGNFILPMNKV